MSNSHSKKKFLISERALNYLLRPVQVRQSNYPYSYDVENLGQKVTVTVDGPWTYANHLILDFIGHEQYIMSYQEIVSKRNSWKNDLSIFLLNTIDKLKEQRYADLTPELEPYEDWFEKYRRARMKAQELKGQDDWGVELDKAKNVISQVEREIENPLLQKFENIYEILANGRGWFSTEINLRNFYDRYKMFFTKRRIEYVTELIKRTAGVKFTLDYPVQHPVFKTYRYNGESRTKIAGRYLETVKVENSRLFNFRIENGILQVKYDTFLGKLYTHNLLTLNTDWFDEDYLKLNGYASAIYRRFFSIRKNVDEIKLRDIVEHFGFANNCRYPEIVKQAFEDIKNAGLIVDYAFIKNSGKFSKGYVEIKMPSK
jgi:hypothetical protein